jgi:hypothetical protein
MNNVCDGKNEKWKVKFMCNIFMNDHLTHQFPQLEESQKILAQQQVVVLRNPFPQGKNISQASSSRNVLGGNQRSPTHNANNGSKNIYMIRSNPHM